MRTLFKIDSNRKSLILIVGLAGTGKSTIAKELSKKIKNSVFLDSDKFIILHPIFKKSKNKDSIKLYYRIHTLKLEKIKSLFKKYKIVVTDATFYDKKIRSLYYKFLEKLNINLIIVKLESPNKTIKKRIFSDPRSYKFGSPKSRYSYYLKRKSSYEPIKEQHTVVKNNTSIKNCVSKILKSRILRTLLY